MMQQTISHVGLMDITRFRIVDFERIVTTVPIGLIGKLAMERKNIAGKSKRKLRYIFALSLAA